MRFIPLAVACVVSLAVAASAKGAIINSSDAVIGGNPYRTFTDQSTGLVWLDLDNFFNPPPTSYNAIQSFLAGSGFHLATLSELQTLQASMPAVPSNFNSDTLIAGGNYSGNPYSSSDRPLIWGIYEDGSPGNGVSWSWKFDTDTSWQFTPNTLSSTASLPDDLGAWVVSNSAVATTPEPASCVIWGALGIAGLIAARRRKKVAA